MGPSFFSNEQLCDLQRVYIDACKDLGIDWSDKHALYRETVAALVVHMAVSGERNPDVIKRRVIMKVTNAA